MDSKEAGHFLSNIFPADGGPTDMLSILGVERTPLQTSFLPSVMMVVPQSYLTRNNRRVDICGTVDADSCEYADGFRYFSSEGEFFYEDGRCGKDGENPCDLVAMIDAQSLHLTSKPPVPYLWVHPQHWVVKAWFQQLDLKKTVVKASERYLNRMGFVIEIVHSVASADGTTVTYWDREGHQYQSSGGLCGQSHSMYDLVSQVRHWEHFGDYDWSSDKGINKKVKEVVPEMFDPTSQANRSELLAEFFAAMSQVNSLADQLGIELGFHMKTQDVNFN